MGKNSGKKGAAKSKAAAAQQAQTPQVVKPPPQVVKPPEPQPKAEVSAKPAAPEPAPIPQVVKQPAPQPTAAMPATPEPTKDGAAGPPVAQKAQEEKTKDENDKPEQIPWFVLPFAFIGDRVKGVPLGMTFKEFQEKRMSEAQVAAPVA